MPNIAYTFSHPSFHGLIGAAREDITPPVGIYARNWGAAKHDVAEGIHRPLTLTALALSPESDHPTPNPHILISADLGWWRTQEDETRIRWAILEALSLPAANVILALTHTHSAPSICREDANKPGGHLIEPYLERLRQAAVISARNAVSSLRPATLTWRYGRCGLAVNRDLPDPDSDRILCGFNPNGPADDTLLVGRAVSTDGETLATIVNYACHPVTLAWQNKLISPDFVGAMRDLVESRTNNAPSLFLMGASGELSPRDIYTGDTVVADRNGRELGYAVLSTLEGMLPAGTALEFDSAVESGAPLAVWREASNKSFSDFGAREVVVELPLKELPSLSKIEREISECSDRALLERLHRSHRVRRLVGDGTTMRFPFWIWRLGDALVLGTGAEPYSVFQIHLRAKFPGVSIAVVNVVNGWGGYLPPAELYDQDIYQVWQTPFAKGSLERLMDAAEKVISEVLATQ